ncbi:Crp/Fnr family transcriptional regulator [Candidatus Daviesbacteria bacterium]|nr:Crp/Fnr family transcriptional regulator [Candidatus Daviesbacteria bacterium]
MINKVKAVKKSTALLTFDAFFEQFPSKIFQKKETILNAGVTPSEIYYLKKGYARTYGVSAEGEELTMVIFQPGDFFPLISTIEPKKIEYYIEAMTEVAVIPVPRNQFIEFLSGGIDLLKEMVLRLTARFEGALQRMEYLSFGTASQKLASIILILGERFGEKKGLNIFIKSPLTHKDLASLIGITRETTTLILSEFSKKGYVVFVKKQLIIKNLKGLQKESLIEAP